MLKRNIILVLQLFLITPLAQGQSCDDSNQVLSESNSMSSLPSFASTILNTVTGDPIPDPILTQLNKCNSARQEALLEFEAPKHDRGQYLKTIRTPTEIITVNIKREDSAFNPGYEMILLNTNLTTGSTKFQRIGNIAEESSSLEVMTNAGKRLQILHSLNKDSIPPFIKPSLELKILPNTSEPSFLSELKTSLSWRLLRERDEDFFTNYAYLNKTQTSYLFDAFDKSQYSGVTSTVPFLSQQSYGSILDTIKKGKIDEMWPVNAQTCEKVLEHKDVYTNKQLNKISNYLNHCEKTDKNLMKYHELMQGDDSMVRRPNTYFYAIRFIYKCLKLAPKNDQGQ